MFKISMLTIGDEICIGQVVNSNAAWIADKCTDLGAEVIAHSVIKDDKENIISELDRLFSFSDLVITTGGLGPTHDDITKLVLTDYFNDKMEMNQIVLNDITELFLKRGREITDRNKEQAMTPTKSIPLKNTIGTAAGLYFNSDGKKVIVLPGVPAEMKAILNYSGFDIIRSLIIEKADNIVVYKTIKTARIFESSLADLIGEPELFLNGGSLAFLPSGQGVRLRIGAIGNDFHEANFKLDVMQKYIEDRAGKYVIGYGNENPASYAGNLMKIGNLTVSVAESCTGGMLGEMLTEISGSSQYFLGGIIVYSNTAKIKQLDVNSETIEVHGAVSEQTAFELAQNVRIKFNSDFGISITGIAGPDGGTPEKPVGTVWIGISNKINTITKKYIFGEDRQLNRERASTTALLLLIDSIKNYDNLSN
jgi:nicotinamide-nucleotide amidase